MRQTVLMLLLIVVSMLSMHFVQLTRAKALDERGMRDAPLLYDDSSFGPENPELLRPALVTAAGD